MCTFFCDKIVTSNTKYKQISRYTLKTHVIKTAFVMWCSIPVVLIAWITTNAHGIVIVSNSTWKPVSVEVSSIRTGVYLELNLPTAFVCASQARAANATLYCYTGGTCLIPAGMRAYSWNTSFGGGTCLTSGKEIQKSLPLH